MEFCNLRRHTYIKCPSLRISVCLCICDAVEMFSFDDPSASENVQVPVVRLLVTLCGHCVGGGAGQTISMSVLARNLNKGLSSRSPARPEVEEERKVSGKRKRAVS